MYFVWVFTCFAPIKIPTNRTLHTGVPTECVYRYILVTIGTVPLLPDIVHGVHRIQVYR